MVNGALGRSLEYPMYSLGRILKALGPSALWDFLNANPWPYHRPDQRSETLRACGPSVFGLWSGLGCGLGFALKIPCGTFTSIFSLGSILSTLGNLPRDSIHHATSSPFPQIVPFFSPHKDCGQAFQGIFILGASSRWCMEVTTREE